MAIFSDDFMADKAIITSNTIIEDSLVSSNTQFAFQFHIINNRSAFGCSQAPRA